MSELRILDAKSDKVVGCYDCGLEYGGESWIEAIIPDKVWSIIRPEGCGEHAGLLCIACICARLKKRGLSDVPVWLCGTEPLKAMAGEPAERLDILRSQVWNPKIHGGLGYMKPEDRIGLLIDKERGLKYEDIYCLGCHYQRANCECPDKNERNAYYAEHGRQREVDE